MMLSQSASLLVLISAPSGGGKTTLCEQVLAADPNAVRAVTCTTRNPRPGEKDGVDYHFLDPQEFQKKVEAGEFLEHATVYGNRYGTLKGEVLDKLSQGKDILLSVDIQGAETLAERTRSDSDLRLALISVFITPASMEILEERLRRRAKDSEETIAQRLSVARAELAHWNRFDYLILSTTVAEDLRRMQAIMAAEKMRNCRVRPPSY
jgi:guanylate kinase